MISRRMCALRGPGLIKMNGAWKPTKITKTMCGLMVDMIDYKRRNNTYAVIEVGRKVIAVPHTRAKNEVATRRYKRK